MINNPQMFDIKQFLNSHKQLTIHFVRVLLKGPYRLISRPTNENLVPSLPGVSHSLQSTVETQFFQCHITQACRA